MKTNTASAISTRLLSQLCTQVLANSRTNLATFGRQTLDLQMKSSAGSLNLSTLLAYKCQKTCTWSNLVLKQKLSLLSFFLNTLNVDSTHKDITVVGWLCNAFK